MTIEQKKRYEFEGMGFPVEFPPLDYRRDDPTTYDVTNITSIVGVPPATSGSQQPPPVLTSAYVLVTTTEGTDYGVGAGWPAANRAILIPFDISESYTVKKLGWINGATVSGNVDVGIYDTNLTRLVSAGSTAQGSISVVQEVDVTDTTLPPGSYYMAMAMDNTTGRVLRSVANHLDTASVGVAQMAAAFPLPATATLAEPVNDYTPLIAVSSRTLLA